MRKWLLCNTKQPEVTGAVIYNGKFSINVSLLDFSISFQLEDFHWTSSTLDDKKCIVGFSSDHVVVHS